MSWLRRLYQWTLKLAGHPKAVYWLAIISFAESSFFPIPPDVLLLPLCMARREQAMRLALICTIASVLGGVFGYALGFFTFDSIGYPILELYGALEDYHRFQEWYAQQGAAVIFVAGFSPIPYKVITITAGVFQYHLGVFILLSVLSRGLRFGIEALLLKRFGETAMTFIDRHFEKLTVVAAILFVGGFLAIKLLL